MNTFRIGDKDKAAHELSWLEWSTLTLEEQRQAIADLKARVRTERSNEEERT